MRLKVSLPTEILVDADAQKVIAEGPEGQFCLLPRHADYTALVVPGVLIYVPAGADGAERYLGVDEGVLVKRARDVMVSLRDAVAGDDRAELRRVVARRFRQLDERERQARSALARLEAGVMRRFTELEER